MDELEVAWVEVHAATPPGWFVGRPGQRHGGQWAMYAFDQTEKAYIGKRSREWTVGRTDRGGLRQGDGAVRERESVQGRVPK